METPNERLVLVKALIAAAYADGELAPVERTRIERLIDWLRIQGDAREEALALLEGHTAAAMPTVAELPSYPNRLYIFHQALLMVHEDGVVLEGEREFIADLAAALAIKEDDVVRGWARAREMAER